VEQLGGLDAMFLSCETPTMHMHVCGLLILDTATMGPGDPFDRITAMLKARLPRIAPMRHRLSTVPLNLGRPFWTDDPDLRIDRHLRRIVLDPPGDDRQLAELVGEFSSTQLQRDRPLWEMMLVEGLPEKRVALLVKMHHSTIDGVTGANLLGQLFDLSPEGLPDEPNDEAAPLRPLQPFELLGQALLDRLRAPADLLKLIPETIGRVGSAVWRAARAEGGSDGIAVPFTAPRTSFNASISGRRSVAFIDVSLEEVKAVKQAVGATVNDVLTALVSSSLRQYLLELGELPERPLIAAEPVSVHGQAGVQHGTTQVSVMFTTLATNVADPLDRLRSSVAADTQAKEFHKLLGADTLLQWTEHLWLNVFSLGAHLYSQFHGADHHPVVHNLILSNVPGPPIPLYFAGARLVGIYPLGPVMDGAGLNVTVLSQEDRVGFGIVACSALVPDPWRIADAIPGALHEMTKAVQDVGST
jgi:WS/DGAT/MGAT family acyltransferase